LCALRFFLRRTATASPFLIPRRNKTGLLTLLAMDIAERLPLR
jgi:hypothetical protein